MKMREIAASAINTVKKIRRDLERSTIDCKGAHYHLRLSGRKAYEMQRSALADSERRDEERLAAAQKEGLRWKNLYYAVKRELDHTKNTKMRKNSYSWFFGPFVAAMRRGSGLSQAELAEMVGVPKSRISKVERQDQPITFDDFMSMGGLLWDCTSDLLDCFISYVVEARQAMYELEEHGVRDPRVWRKTLNAIADKVVSEELDQ